MILISPILVAVGFSSSKLYLWSDLRSKKLLKESTLIYKETIKDIETVQNLTLESICFEKFANSLLVPNM